MKERAQHLFRLGLAWLVLLAGALFLVSPIPVGVFLIAVGLSMLVSASDALAVKVQHYRSRNRQLNKQLIRVEERLSNRIKFVGEAMRKTRPASEQG